MTYVMIAFILEFLLIVAAGLMLHHWDGVSYGS